jgi:hypothetical protein
VIRLDPRVPREETDVERFHARALAEASPPFDELVPEAGGGPVLDRTRRGRRNLVVLVCIEPLELVAEVQRRARTEAPFAKVHEIEPELPRHAHEQLKVSGRKVKGAAFDAAECAAEHSVAAGAAIADADFVGKDLLGRAHFLQALRVQHLLELGDEELVREHRELDQKRPRLFGAEVALLEPHGVGVSADRGMAEHLTIEAGPKGCWRRRAHTTRLVLRG